MWLLLETKNKRRQLLDERPGLSIIYLEISPSFLGVLSPMKLLYT